MSLRGIFGFLFKVRRVNKKGTMPGLLQKPLQSASENSIEDYNSIQLIF